MFYNKENNNNSCRSKKISGYSKSMAVLHALIIIGAGVAVQLVATSLYYGKNSNYVYDGFYALIFIPRIFIPICVGFIIKLSLSEMGVSFPAPLWKGPLFIVLAMALITIIIIFGMSLESVSSYYLNTYEIFYGDKTGFTKFFLLFTISANISWEFLHRGFLLFGLEKTLRSLIVASNFSNAGKISKNSLYRFNIPAFIAILIVWIFEISLHITKPFPEIIGMGVASILLSMLALKSRSIAYPMLLHFYIEFVLWFAIVRLL